ncbi:hypothetical protein [Streptomyces sp. NPDC051183]|uniref:hypothetical protein n=1 Tax=Streptomyces sp. NPDC051183 TaxID=3155165 RepID=UPI00342DFABA
MAARLAAAVHVQHPQTREWVVLEPGAEPAHELASEITNPDAWENGVLPEAGHAEEDGPPPFGFVPTEPSSPEPEPEPEPTPQRRRTTTTT